MKPGRAVQSANLVVIAACAAVAALSSTAEQWSSPMLLALLAAGTAVSTWLSQRHAGLVRFSGEIVPLGLAMVLLGPAPAALIAAACVVVHARPRAGEPDTRLDNVVNALVHVLAGAVAFRLADVRIADPLGGAAVFGSVLLSSWVSYGVLALQERRDGRRLGLALHRTMLPYVALGALVATIAAWAYDRDGLAMLGPMMAVLVAFEVLMGRLGAVEIQLRHDHERARACFDGAGTLMVLLDPEGRVQSLNRRGSALLGIAEAEAVGRRWTDLAIAPEHRRAVDRRLTQLVEDGLDTTAYRTEIVAADGARRLLSCEVAALREQGVLRRLMLVGVDATEQRAAQERAEYLAYHDVLTGLGNRAALERALTPALEASRRHGRAGALVVVDLDGFKAVNDELGHQAGDELLALVARRIETVIRDGDLLVRQGGDEFVVVVEDLQVGRGASEVSARAAADAMTERLRARIAEPYAVGGHVRRIGASVGVAVLPFDGEDADRVMTVADGRMYDDKGRGRAPALV